MRKSINIVLALALMSLSIISCSKEDDDNSDSLKIVGVWYETSYWVTHESSGTPNTWHTWGWVSPPVHEFLEDKTYKEYNSKTDYKEGKVFRTGTYTFDGEYLAINGGFKRRITFTESGDAFEWERNAICTRYTGK